MVLIPQEAIAFVNFEIGINFGRFLFCDKRDSKTRLTGNFSQSFQTEVWVYCIPCELLSLLELTYYGYPLKVLKLCCPVAHEMRTIGRRFWDAGLVRFWVNLGKLHTRYTLQEYRNKSFRAVKKNDSIINLRILSLVFVVFIATSILVIVIFIIELRRKLYYCTIMNNQGL